MFETNYRIVYIPSHSAAAYSFDLEQENCSCLQPISDLSDSVHENSAGNNGRDGLSRNVPDERVYSENNNKIQRVTAMCISVCY